MDSNIGNLPTNSSIRELSGKIEEYFGIRFAELDGWPQGVIGRSKVFTTQVGAQFAASLIKYRDDLMAVGAAPLKVRTSTVTIVCNVLHLFFISFLYQSSFKVYLKCLLLYIYLFCLYLCFRFM